MVKSLFEWWIAWIFIISKRAIPVSITNISPWETIIHWTLESGVAMKFCAFLQMFTILTVFQHSPLFVPQIINTVWSQTTWLCFSVSNSCRTGRRNKMFPVEGFISWRNKLTWEDICDKEGCSVILTKHLIISMQTERLAMTHEKRGDNRAICALEDICQVFCVLFMFTKLDFQYFVGSWLFFGHAKHRSFIKCFLMTGNFLPIWMWLVPEH